MVAPTRYRSEQSREDRRDRRHQVGDACRGDRLSHEPHDGLVERKRGFREVAIHDDETNGDCARMKTGEKIREITTNSF